MRILKFYKFLLTVVLLYHVMTICEMDPITDQAAVELKFLSQRKKLRVARKINPIGSKMLKHYVEADPVCGMNGWDIVQLCVRVAERYFDDRTLAFGLSGSYKKSVMKPTPETCLKGRVLLQSYPKKAIRVNMYKCPLSNYIFEQAFEVKDFYITSSSSLKKVYILRDLYDTSPLYVGEFKEELISILDGRLLTKSELMKNSCFTPSTPEPKNSNVSSSEMDDTDKPLNPIENITVVQIPKPSDDGVYVGDDGRVIGRLYALVDGLKLKRVYVHREPRKKDPNKVGFWRKLWIYVRDKIPRIGKSGSSERDSVVDEGNTAGSQL